MPHSKNWLPGKRGEQLKMANTWSIIIKDKGPAYGISAKEIKAFIGVVKATDKALTASSGKEKGPVKTAECQDAFKKMRANMRFLKDRYFKAPLLANADLIALGLKPRKAKTYNTSAPSAIVKGDASNPGPGQVLVIFHKFESTLEETSTSDLRIDIRMGVFDLGYTPKSQSELTDVRSTHRKKLLYRYGQENTGKRSWFCGRYVSGSDHAGDWGPMFSAIIT
jgi:hypothetical protein